MTKKSSYTLPLTFKRRQFAEHYARLGNARQAASLAGYSPKTATVQGSQMLDDPRVQEVIQDANERAAKALGLNREMVIQELAHIAMADMRNLITQDEEGNTNVRLAGLTKDVTSPISEIKITTSKGKVKTQNTQVKLADKSQALISLAKMLGWYEDKVQVSATVSLEKLIENSFKND